MVETESPTTLRILLVTDEHENWTNLDKLIAREEPASFDFVFLSGDQANCNNQVGQLNNVVENERAEASNRRFVESLAVMHKSGGKLYYIPGNHDAEVLMDAETMTPISPDSVNLHNRVTEIVPGLLIAGLGGSLPTLFKQDGQNDWVNCFNPYPYLTEADYTAAITSLWTDKVQPRITQEK